MRPGSPAAIRCRFSYGDNLVARFQDVTLLQDIPRLEPRNSGNPEDIGCLVDLIQIAGIEPVGEWAIHYENGDQEDELIVTAWRLDQPNSITFCRCASMACIEREAG